MAEPTRVALALGSGGARGYAHIGVIQVLEERGYEVVAVAGTSMGALVGGLHAAGKLDAYTEWVTGLNQRDVLRLLDPSIRAPGAIRAEKILARVSELLDGALIEELPTSFTAVATDLLARREVWFQRGPVDAAIRASIALPSFITPVMLNGRLLADGGLLNPIPIAPTAAAEADMVVAVSLAGELEGPAGQVPAHESSEARPTEEWLDRFRRSASRVLDRDIVRLVTGRLVPGRTTTPGSATEEVAEELAEQVADRGALEVVEEPVFGTLPAGLRMLDVMELSLDAMQNLVTRYRLAAYPPDVLVTVPKGACRTLDFHKANEMIALGRELTEQALDGTRLSPTS